MRQALFFLVMSASFIANAAVADTHEPEVMGVLFYADWCGSCQILDPVIAKARGKANLDNESILFVTLDLTNETTRHQSAFMAHTLGISDFYEDNDGGTGFMALIDADNGKVISRLNKTMDAATMANHINMAIAKASKK